MNCPPMPQREAGDGDVEIRLLERLPPIVEVRVTTDGRTDVLRISRYNAFRVVGALAVLLGIPLSRAAAKAITF